MGNSATKKIAFTLLIACGVPFYGNTQAKPAIDSLYEVLPLLKDDSLKVDALMRLGRYYLNSSPDSVLYFAKKIGDIGRKKDDPLALATSFQLAGIGYEIKGDYNTALRYFLQAIPQLERLEDLQKIAYVKNSMAVVYRKNGDQKNALKSYQEALRVSEAAGDTLAAATIKNNLGNLYADLGDNAQAAEQLRKAIELRRNMGDDRGLAQSLNSLSQLEYRMGKYEAGAKNVDQAVALYEKTGDLRGLSLALVNQGNLGVALGQHTLAENAFRRSLSIGRKMGTLDNVLLGLKSLTHLDSLRGNYQSAFSHLQAYTALKDSLFNESKAQQIAELTTRYQTAEQEKEIALLQQENAVQQLKNRQQRMGLIGGVAASILFGLAALLFYRLGKQREQANRQIAEQNRLIQQALKEKELLLREIHHRAKNNLYIIESLLNIQTRQLEDAGARSALQDSRARVRAIGLIHQQLYQRQGDAYLALDQYLRELGENLKGSLFPSNVSLEQHLEPLNIRVDKTVPLGLLANEAMTNAIKHAFPGNRGGRIRLSLSRLDEQKARLEISDDGVGYHPEPAAAGGAGSGADLLRGLADQLEGKLEVFNGQGSTIRLTFPVFSDITVS